MNDEDREKAASERAKQDLDLWHNWNNNGRQPEHLKPLLNQYQGMIQTQVRRYANNVEIPTAVIEAEYTKQFVNAVNTYKPDRGAALGSWVMNNLQKSQRWIGAHQNVARITEGRLNRIGDFNRAKADLSDELGREPSSQEIAEHMGRPLKMVTRLEKELRKSYVASAMEFDPVQNMPSVEREALAFIPYELNDQEKVVFEYTMGINGKPKLNATQIAQQLNISNSTVSRIKTRIAKVAKKWIP
jgi:DNA-directed RNA polymerase specialized sigma subunit